MQIRIARQADLEQIVDIYNQAVAEGNCTADTEAITVAERQQWFDDHGPEKYPIYVMTEGGHSGISAWCSLSAHRKGRMALQNVAEISYYVDSKYRGRGIGGQIMQFALQEAPNLGLHNLFAILLDTNHISVAFLEKSGFSKWGHFPEIAEFPDRVCGQYIYGRKV